MKKLNPIYFLGLLVLLLAGCSVTRTEIEASIDGSKRRFSGPSYPNPSPDNLSFDENVMFSIIVPMSAAEAGHAVGFNPYRADTANLYASSTKGPAFLMIKPQKSDELINHLFFKGGLELIGKRSSDGGSTTTLNYLEIPLYALYDYHLEGTGMGTVFGGLGPYFAYGIGGNLKGGGYKVSAFDSPDGFKRFDAGLGITAGYRLPEGFSFRLGYEFGLANIQNNAFGDKAVNRTISLNVGYPLDKLIDKIKGK